MKRNKFKKRSFLTLGAVMAIFASANYCPALAADYNLNAFSQLQSALENGNYNTQGGVSQTVQSGDRLITSGTLYFGDNGIDVSQTGLTVVRENFANYMGSGTNTGFNVLNGVELTLDNLAINTFQTAVNINNGATVNFIGGSYTSSVVNSGASNIQGGIFRNYFQTADTSASTTTSGNVTLNGNITSGSFTSNGTLNFTDGEIAAAVNTEINDDTIISNGTLTLDSSDTWSTNADITLNSGTLNLDGVTQGGTLNAAGGNLNLNGTDLTISTGSQIAGAVNTQLNSGSLTVNGTGSVTLNQGDAWNVETTLTNGSLTLDNITQGTNASLNATGGGLVVNSDLNMAEGSMIAETVNANVSGDLTVSGGEVVFNNGDTWNSDTTLTNGSLALDDMTRGNDASLYATGGNLNLGAVELVGNDNIGQYVVTTITDDVVLNGLNVNVQLDGRGSGADNLAGGSVTVKNGVLSLNNLATTNTAIITDNLKGALTLNNVTLDNDNDYINANLLSIEDNITVNKGEIYVQGTDEWDGVINLAGENANLNLANVIQGENGSLNATNGNLTVNNITLTKTKDIIAEAVKTTVAGDFTVSNGEVILDGATDALQTGTLTLNSNGTLTMNGLTTENVNLIAQGGTLNLDNVTLNNDNDYIHFDSNVTFAGDLNITKGTVELDSKDNLSAANNTITLNGENATLGVDGLATDTTKFNLEKGTLHIVGDGLTLNNADDLIQREIHTVVDGDLNINKGQVYLNNDDEWNEGTIHVATDGSLQFENFNKSYGNVLIMDGENSLTELVNSTVAVVDAGKITDGTINIDNTSSFVVQDGTMNLDTLNSSGVLSALNSTFEDHTINNLNVINNDFTAMDNSTFTGDAVADFTIDIYARLRDYNQNSDTFSGEAISALDASGGTVNISDWVLRGNLRRQDAPIDRYYDFKIFDYDTIADNINITATDKETFTPIGYYRLFSNGDGSYTLGLTRYNKQVFRAQATTLAQYNNQLAIDDIVTSHFTLHNAAAYRNSNRFAAATPSLGPYLYNQKDGGLWFKSYADIERLSMTQDLNVHNTAYGAIIGADLPVFDLEDGWKFIPTTYIGYNGAHQSFNDVSAYQNGGQLGFMGTFIKDNFVSSHTVYGGGYYNEMHVDGVSDETANWFWGTAHRAAYNWRIKNHFIIQPTAFISYNMFGEQNFHSEFGEMGMKSGMLNGINVAPGVNFIWADDDWSLYAGVQYMYNINEQVSGRAGNVYLPNLHMRHGYIQYGIGGTKNIKDNLASYAQVMFRNAGRTGVAFQIGLQYSFDLNEIIQKITTAFKKTKNIANK